MALKRRAFHTNRPVGSFREGPGIRLRIGAPVNVEGIRRPWTRSACRNLHVQPNVVRYWGGETELTPQGALGTIGKGDRKSTRLNSSHRTISYAVFCLKK